MQDMVRKGRHVPVNRIEALVPRMRGEKSNFARLKEAEVLVIRERRVRGETLAAIAAAYNVCPTTIGDIVAGRTWSHV